MDTAVTTPADGSTPSVPSLSDSAVPTPETSTSSTASADGGEVHDESRDSIEIAPQDGLRTPRPGKDGLKDGVQQLRAKLEAQAKEDREK